jgi:hypothetical protein
VELDAYRAQAEAFVSALDREYYLHFSGQRDSYEIEPIYERHAGLFSRRAVEELRERGHRELLEFAAEGFIGRATGPETAELARREAALELMVDGRRLPFRESLVAQANEPDPDGRAALEVARLELTERELNPLLRERLERSHALARELGWPSMRAMCEELSGMDLGGLAAETAAFLRETEASYEGVMTPRLEEQLGFGLEALRRSDLPAFFRAPALDAVFPAERLLESLRQTLAGLGIDIDAQPAVVLDTAERPKKSPRAFCAPVRVPDEVYLVIAPIGGRDDYMALFHEAGHAEHYAHAARALPVEHRYLGDNSVTEGFAFLLEHLTAAPEWLRRRLGVADPDSVVDHARAVKLLFLRRYAAKLSYELELHDAPAGLDGLDRTYVDRLSRAVRVDWPRAAWLSDVDPFFYAARYLRAWALETRLRGALRERHGEAWFAEPAAGALLRGLWSRGQSVGADELAAELDGGGLEFSVLLEEWR